MAQKSAKGKKKTTRGGRPAPFSKSKIPTVKGNGQKTGGRSHLSARRGIFSSLRRPDKPSPLPGKTAQPARPVRSITSGLSLDRKLDILGIFLALLGLLTILALLSPSKGTITAGWINAISQAFGWGVYLFPLSLMAVGLWLVLRSFERVPQPSLERIIGFLLLYTNLLVILHFFAFPDSSKTTYALAAAGKGGGYLGGFLFWFLYSNLGRAGAAIALLAWFLISLGLTLDVSIPELFRWVSPTLVRMQDWWDDHRNHRGEPLSPPLQGQDLHSESSGKRLAGTAGQPTGSITRIPTSPPNFAVSSGGAPHAWSLPPLEEMLDKGDEIIYDDEYDRQRARIIEETLASFGAPVNVVEINRGPTITQFGVEPNFLETRGGRMRVRVGKIASLADDLALALSAKTIRVQAPVPGRGYVGIEVPNEAIALVTLRDVVECEAFQRLKSSLRFALGEDVAGNAVAADLTNMPHLLIAGATGSGKSVCVNALICCFLLNNTPDDLRLVLVDPKRVELTGYNGIPHLLAPVVVEMERVVGALQWILREMDSRYHKLAQAGCRNIADYNARAASTGEKKLPHLVVLIDELADLMMLAPDETERTVTRLAQLARATGIHLVIATQRPSVDVVTGLIKANFPARIAFAVASGVDSRVILDQPGAERLLGRGDMLFQAPDAAAPLRLQGVFVSEGEIQRLVDYWHAQAGIATPTPTSAGGIVDALPAGIPLKQMPLWENMIPEDEGDPLLNEAIDLVRRQGRASISMLQRRLRIGYTRAARMIETLQEKRIIGTEAVGVQGFEILDYGPAAPPADES